MYQAIYYERKKNLIHLWDDKEGYLTESFEKYAYAFRDSKEPTEYKSIFGNYVKKYYPEKYGSNQENSSIDYESDVNPTTRYLIDNYLQDEYVSKDFNTLFYDIETETKFRKIDTLNTPNIITSIAVHYSLTNKRKVYILNDTNSTNVNTNLSLNIEYAFFNEEKSMLIDFIKDYQEQQPKALSGWNITGFDNPYLYNRIQKILSTQWANKLSPIGLVSIDEISNEVNFAGVVTFDYMVLYEKFQQEKKSSYSLENISQEELGKGKIKYNGSLDDFRKNDLQGFIEYNINDVDLVLELDKKLNYIELSRLICHMCRTPYETITFPSRYIEGAILTYLRKQNIIANNTQRFSKMKLKFHTEVNSTKIQIGLDIDKRLPTKGKIKVWTSKTSFHELSYTNFSNNTFYLEEKLDLYLPKDSDVSVSFAGGYVKEPIPGLYEWLMSIDATSLYPSIIRTLKICSENKVGKILNWKENTLTNYLLNDNTYAFTEENNFNYLDDNLTLIFEDSNKKTTNITKEKFVNLVKNNNLMISSNGILYKDNGISSIPNILTEWFNLRLEYKKKAKTAKTPEEETYYDNRQYSVKILLNSVYGVLGMPGFRFYDLDNAEATTLTGQEGNKYIGKLIKTYYKKRFNDETDPVIYGDTDSLYIQLNKNLVNTLSEDELVQSADLLCDVANKGFDLFSKHSLNAKTSYLEFKREKVCKRAFMLAKKRYGLLVVDNEGKRVNKITVIGLDIKKSSYPKYFIKTLSEILNSILINNDVKITNEIIIKAYNNLNKVEILDLCNTSSVKDLEDYKKRTNGIKFEKGIPVHGKAALRYNFLLEYYKSDTKYGEINASEKIKWCYLLKNSFGFDSMAIKNDIVPNNIIEFITSYIDRKKMFNNGLKTKIDSFYEALGWNYPNINEKKTSKFF
jgi:DNA polymerase elongation subunit (family B)